MAKNPVRTNAVDMPLDPSTFNTTRDQNDARQTSTMQPKPKKSLTRNISITLQEEAIEKLNRLAEEEDISKSKFINRLIMSL